MLCTSALTTDKGCHLDSPSWSREPCGHVCQGAGLGPPPSSCPLPHGALRQSLPAMFWFASSFCFHQDDVKCFVESFSLTICIVAFRIFLAGSFFQALMRSVVASGEGVSGPVVRPTVATHTRFITNGCPWMKHGRGRCNGIEMISRGSLNKS